MTLPHVTAVCVTGKTQRHLDYWLPMALDSLEAQTYPQVSVLVVGPMPSITEPLTGATEIYSSPGLKIIATRAAMPLGQLRNVALDMATDGMFGQADDDDWHGSDRIAQQVAASNNGELAVTLQRQIRYDVDTDCAYVYDGGTTWGIHGTILHPATEHRYPEIARGEDTAFLQHFKDRLVVLDNDPKLYVRFSHGDNTSGRKHVMGPLADKQHEWQLDRDQAEYLREVLAEYEIER